MGSWYLDNAAAGTNAGTSWTNAWETFGDVVWGVGGVVAGDTLYISGGAVSKTYTATAHNMLTAGASGSSGSPITIATGAKSPSPTGHAGTVIFDGDTGSFYYLIKTHGRNYITLDGEKSGASNWTIQNADVTTEDGTVAAVSMSSGTGCKALYITIASAGNGIYATAANAIEVAYCTFSDIRYDHAIKTITGNSSATAFGLSSIHHNTFQTNYSSASGFGPDTIQLGKSTDIYNNTFSTAAGTVIGGQHPDMVQSAGRWLRVYNNVFRNFVDSAIDVDMKNNWGETATHLWIFNNVFTADSDNSLPTPAFPSGIRIYAPLDAGGELSDVVISNNTFADMYFAADGAGNCIRITLTGTESASDFHIKNNLFYNCARSGYYITTISASSGAVAADWGFDFNLINAGAHGVTDVSIDGASYTQSSPRTGVPTFVSYVESDPTNDYSLDPTDIEARNQGTVMPSSFATDRVGTVRPVSYAWDIGASECTSGSVVVCYVDYDAANDTGDGLTDSTPWKYCPGDSRAAAGHTLAHGDVVYFKKGVTYSGHIDTYTSGVTYTTTTWGTGVAVIDGTGTAACIDVSHGDCTITGGTAETLKLTGADIKAAVHVYNATSGVNGLTVSYVTFEDIGTSGSQERIGLKVGGSEDEYQNIAISYCTFTNCVYYAIKVSGNPTHDVTIHHNTITNCGSGGGCQINVSQSGTTGAGITACSIYSNTIHTGAGTSGGINILNPGVNVYSNTIYGHTAHGLLFTFQAYAQEGVVDVYKNLIRDNAGVGIKINYTTAAKHCQVYNNLIARNGSDADLSINTYADSNEIYNNSIYADSGVTIAAIWCSVSSNSNVIKNNAVHSTNKPCLLEASGDTTEDYNVFYSPNSSTVSYGGTAYTVLATYRTAKSQGANSVWSDPIFPSPGGNDFAITDGSPCVDAGMDASAILTDDYAGTTRGATYDAGAYEYVPGVDPPGFYVYYLGNGSLSGSIPSDSTPYPENDPVTVIGNTGSLVKYSFYEFMGWNTAADGSGQRYGAGDTFTMPAADKVLYAEWRCKGIVFG